MPVARPLARRAGAPVAAALGLGLLVFGVGGLLRPPASSRAATDVALRAPAAPAATTEPETPASIATTSADLGDDRPAAATHGRGIVDRDRPGRGDRRRRPLRRRTRRTTCWWSATGTATARPRSLSSAPASGEVFVFDGWAEAGQDTVAGSSPPCPAPLGAGHRRRRRRLPHPRRHRSRWATHRGGRVMLGGRGERSTSTFVAPLGFAVAVAVLLVAGQRRSRGAARVWLRPVARGAWPGHRRRRPRAPRRVGAPRRGCSSWPSRLGGSTRRRRRAWPPGSSRRCRSGGVPRSHRAGRRGCHGRRGVRWRRVDRVGSPHSPVAEQQPIQLAAAPVQAEATDDTVTMSVLADTTGATGGGRRARGRTQRARRSVVVRGAGRLVLVDRRGTAGRSPRAPAHRRRDRARTGGA